MYLVNADGRLTRVRALALLNPGAVTPAERVVEGGNGSGSRTVFCVLCERVSLKDDFSGLGGDGKFIQFPRFDARNEAFVNAGGFQHLHRAGIWIPVVEVAYHAYGCCMGSPYSKAIAIFTIEGFRMGTEFIVNFVVGAFPEQVTVAGGNKAGLGLLFLISDCHKVNPP